MYMPDFCFPAHPMQSIPPFSHRPTPPSDAAVAKATAHYTSRDGVDWLNGLDLFAAHHKKKHWFVPLWHAIRDCHVGYAKMTLSHGDWCVCAIFSLDFIGFFAMGNTQFKASLTLARVT